MKHIISKSLFRFHHLKAKNSSLRIAESALFAFFFFSESYIFPAAQLKSPALRAFKAFFLSSAFIRNEIL